MAVKVYINGAICDPGDATISVFDRGFLYGDSVYEVMRTSGGNPVDLDPHIERLHRSAAALELALPTREQIVDATRQTLRAADNPESYIRIVVTRGCGEIGLDTALADEPGLIVIAKPLRILSEESYTHGIKLRIVNVQRTPRRAVDPAVKSGNYLNNIMALHEARRSGADEALMCDTHGRIAEGASSNVFVVVGERVMTPAVEIGLLAGITRQRVIDLATEAGIEVREATLKPDEVRSADEVFITSSIRGVVPVASIDECAPRRPVVGPVTAAIMRLYQDYLAGHGRSK